MKKLFLNFGVYAATFFIGVTIVLFLHFTKTKETFVETPKHIPLEIESVDSPKEIAAIPKIFTVQHLDEVENSSNKHFIEVSDVSNGEDFKIKSGETWLGLFKKGAEYRLQETKVQLRKSKEDGLYWTNISVKDKDPVFLVKNLKKVNKGKVETLFGGVLSRESNENNSTTVIGKDFFREFKLGERTYRLKVEQGLSEKHEKIAVLLLETDTESQIIDVVYTDGDWVEMGSLYWVGDLDSDGKLDLYKDFWNYEKGYYLSGLFLSSEAEKGKLVKRFDYLAYGGC